MMNAFVNELLNTANETTTANGDKAYKSTKSALVDFFYFAGSARLDKSMYNFEDLCENLLSKFSAAFKENPKLATVALFWLRDIRGGAGQREAFRYLVSNALKNPEMFPYVVSTMNLISEYGRWDDLWMSGFTDNSKVTPLIKYLLEQGIKDPKTQKLLAKWLPREKSKNKEYAAKLANILELTPRAYRKFCSAFNTETVEVKQSAGSWNEIVFEHVPSIAMQKYENAFARHCENRFEEYKEKLKSGKTKINAGAVYPYQVIKSALSGSEIADAQWKALEDFVPAGMTFMPMVDVSGSMTCPAASGISCLDVAVSLGLYLSERQKGPFKDMFLTFSANPNIEAISSTLPLAERIRMMRRADWGMNTNICRAMDKILQVAVKSKASQNDLPNVLLILSDMQFDQSTHFGETMLEASKRKFAEKGYKLPKIVFWNLSANYNNVPATANEHGVSLVSGFSPSIMKHVLADEEFTPYDQVVEVLTSERYHPVLEAIHNLK